MNLFEDNEIIKTSLDLVNSRTSAIRRVRRLLPLGSKVHPTTFANGMLIEERWIDGQNVKCAMLDSIPSQANRIEGALYRAVKEKLTALPDIIVEIGDGSLGVVSVYELPNRISDQTLWDSILKVEGGAEIPFSETEAGRAFMSASQGYAGPLLDWAPLALLLGYWRSTGKKNSGQGKKLGRALLSEVIGLNPIRTYKSSGRSDPLGIRTNAAVLYEREDGEWTIDENNARRDEKGKPIKVGKKKAQGKPSIVGYGSITPAFSEGGVSITEARQTIILSLAAIRSLRFTGRDEAKCRAVLTALALCAVELALPETDHLRSGCDLFEDALSVWECMPNGTGQNVNVTIQSALECLRLLPDAAEAIGANWRREPLILRAREDLVRLVERSQLIAGSEEESEDDNDADNDENKEK